MVWTLCRPAPGSFVDETCAIAVAAGDNSSATTTEAAGNCNGVKVAVFNEKVPSEVAGAPPPSCCPAF